MVVSLNRQVDLTKKANFMNGGLSGKQGEILIGDRAFEFYNGRNPEDFIQIPWQEIAYVRAQIYFNDRYIRGFYIDTHKDGSFNFVVKDAGKVLKIMSAYLNADQLVRNKPAFSLSNLFKKGDK